MNILTPIASWFRKEKEKLQNLSPKKKFDYIITYYTSWFIGILIVCLFIGFIGDALIQSRKEIVLQGYFTNDDLNYFPGSQMEKEYASVLALSNHQRIVFDDSLYFDLEGTADEYTAASNGKVIATMAVNQLDFMVTTLPVLEHFKGELPMKDLEKFLPEDVLDTVRDDLVLGLDENGEEAYVGIDMAKSRYLRDISAETSFYLFVPYNIPNETRLIEFLRYCFLE